MISIIISITPQWFGIIAKQSLFADCLFVCFKRHKVHQKTNIQTNNSIIKSNKPQTPKRLFLDLIAQLVCSISDTDTTPCCTCADKAGCHV